MLTLKHECKTCKRLLDGESFYQDKGGRLKRSKCKDCFKEYRRNHQRSDPQVEKRRSRYLEKRKDTSFVDQSKNRSEKFYYSLEGRAKTLLSSARRRSSLGEFDLDEEWFIEKLKNGVCEITGIPFDFSKPTGTSKNPYSPSIDRIDPSKGYCKRNCRVVLWQVNLALGEMLDKDVLHILEKLVEGLKRYENST